VSDHTYPPPVITAWLRHEAVDTDTLIEEFRYWGNRMAGGDGHGPFPAGRVEDGEP
jgi:hypothetical protein